MVTIGKQLNHLQNIKDNMVYGAKYFIVSQPSPFETNQVDEAMDYAFPIGSNKVLDSMSKMDYFCSSFWRYKRETLDTLNTAYDLKLFINDMWDSEGSSLCSATFVILAIASTIFISMESYKCGTGGSGLYAEQE
ncbi:unnamed protein product [Medioppia subpectinata]|uniref:Uncharacterized protein n=1 Tax=Medioppia subpectinata TaxID=1979941 RepID=A0A7R9KT22_9ACAR|nr:unnamed protein product [Medioppia subpectinata]CAG2108087.1 unnamed protein product [Medioppia subpectinata]